MNYETYQPLARRTETQQVHFHWEDKEKYQRLIHAQCGMTTEVIEFMFADDDANKNEELGDIFWYLDLGCSVLGWTIGSLNPVRHKELEKTDLILFGLGEYTDVLKRRYYYGKDLEHWKNQVHQAFGMILAGLTDIIVEEGFEIHDILEKNIEKLRIRQPGKFSTEAAINRDVEKERQVFTP